MPPVDGPPTRAGGRAGGKATRSLRDPRGHLSEHLCRNKYAAPPPTFPPSGSLRSLFRRLSLYTFIYI